MKKVFKVLANKYLLTTVAFLAWTIYFDQNDYITLQQRQREVNGLRDNIAYLNTEINRMNKEKNELLTDPRKQEQYARENYRMKHDGEDVYVIDNVSENSMNR
jgi:cell division protein DivIC